MTCMSTVSVSSMISRSGARPKRYTEPTGGLELPTGGFERVLGVLSRSTSRTF